MHQDATSPALGSVPASARGVTVLRSLRIHQWVKNVLIFVPLVLGGRAGESAVWTDAALAFAALCMTCSATYLINDLADLESDRRHRTKRYRPIASGNLSIANAVMMAAAGLAIGLVVGFHLGTDCGLVLLAYVALTLTYTFALKKVPIVDVTVIAALFTLRLALGIAVSDVRLSPWLLVFSMFSFLSLCLAKRNTEVQLLDVHHGFIQGRGYAKSDAPLILSLGVAAALSATMILILYLVDDAFPRGFYGHPQRLWALPAILFLFFGRMWLVSQRSELRDDPVEFALKDPASLLYGTAAVLTVALAIA